MYICCISFVETCYSLEFEHENGSSHKYEHLKNKYQINWLSAVLAKKMITPNASFYVIMSYTFQEDGRVFTETMLYF